MAQSDQMTEHDRSRQRCPQRAIRYAMGILRPTRLSARRTVGVAAAFSIVAGRPGPAGSFRPPFAHLRGGCSCSSTSRYVLQPRDRSSIAKRHHGESHLFERRLYLIHVITHDALFTLSLRGLRVRSGVSPSAPSNFNARWVGRACPAVRHLDPVTPHERAMHAELRLGLGLPSSSKQPVISPQTKCLLVLATSHVHQILGSLWSGLWWRGSGKAFCTRTRAVASEGMLLGRDGK